MSLSDWAKSGWLKAQQPTRDQIAKIFGVVDRDIEDSKRNLSPDGQFNIAYTPRSSSAPLRCSPRAGGRTS
jgi:hypothetical protein